jgi:exodeoxyribonuclease-5
MTLTSEQGKALKAILLWVLTKSSPWIFTVAGYAGTGKTTLLRALIKELADGSYICCAPTGKAASVLRGKVPGLIVRTIHQVLYQPQGKGLEEYERLLAEITEAKGAGNDTTALEKELADERERLKKEKVRFTVKPGQDISNKLLIVDEASMVSAAMLEDFKNTRCKVLFVGDSGQLPPVKAAEWFIEHKHDVSLVKIMRQEADNPIIRLSMAIREGAVDASQFKTGNCRIVFKEEVQIQEWLDADQIITGSNTSRRRINRFMRKRLERGGPSGLPVTGDKMICLKNDHYQLPPWINGIQFQVTEDCNDPGDGFYHLTGDYNGARQTFDWYPYHALVHYFQDQVEEPIQMRSGLFEADYAYAVTVHKSQGSEWDKVVVADDRMFAHDKEFRKRWLYTAVTRARKELIIATDSK